MREAATHPEHVHGEHVHGEHVHGVHRRSLLVGAGGLLMLAAAPGSAHAATVPTTEAGEPMSQGAARASRISDGTQLVHADLHNHTVLSDGDGAPEAAFVSMREAGLDVAALTDHTTMFGIGGLTSAQWRLTGDLADAADDPGQYTAIRGFEWSHPLLGHVNVWFTDDFADLLRAGSVGSLYRWLTSRSGLASLNHPGREAGRFENFRLDPAAVDQLVGLEIFNRREDYLFRGWSSGQRSPLVACLNAGWRTGLTGVTDEHGTDWGFPEGKGRSGLWVVENTRAAVYEAMRARRFFATRVSGLRVDATANGVRMGGSLPIAQGDVQFRLDLDRGPDWVGLPLVVQVLRPGTDAPAVVEVVELTAGEILEFTVPLDRADGDWVLLRVADPAEPNDTPGPAGHPCNNRGVAYTSPWWLDPA
ncbi:CehA/McbA family metallohydrolase [Natronosporangium hydrolyticum]|uniref:CehA/McbA family metallohydrolase n=1 Tax=Natronosporangium hydrolyticum TaxID=2811111 RepID=A0A895YG66_9ACTN|nr:CehA/McbA family metallohydrolase [Natronosporangium hydrolyticum]QSB16561.1 CehA/McbA family metallohydrolase [Natronosporangium hydrolyticum]